MTMNLWHDIKPGNRDEMTVIVEINKGSHNKYEVDKETGLIALDRVSHTSQNFPFDYGFVPQSLWADGDPLDVVLLTTYPLTPGILVKARPVAILNMTDSGDSDAKIIAVPVEDPRFDDVTDIDHVNKHTLKEIEHFYQTYKKIQNKVVETHGFDGAAKAKEAFDISMENYKNKFNK